MLWAIKAIWIITRIKEIELNIVDILVVRNRRKKMVNTKLNATNITRKLKYAIVSGWLSVKIIAIKLHMINIVRMIFLKNKTSFI